MPITQAELEEIQSEIASIRTELTRLVPPDEHLPDDTRERWRSRLAARGDIDLIVELLSIHKLLEYQAHGKALFLAEAEATAITTVLDRFLPDVAADAFAVYEEHAVPIDEALATT